jgi:hypothetical protein
MFKAQDNLPSLPDYVRALKCAVEVSYFLTVRNVSGSYEDHRYIWIWMLLQARLRPSRMAHTVGVFLAILVSRPSSPRPSASATNGIDDEEKRKAEKKAKKAAAKAKSEQAAKKCKWVEVSYSAVCSISNILETAANPPPSKGNEDEPPPAKDEDPNGDTLAATKTPLEDALKFLRILQESSSSDPDVWLLSYKVATRRSEFLWIARSSWFYIVADFSFGIF